jgi:ankyrin repeat protein
VPELIAAADRGDLETVRKILDSGVKPDEIKDKYGQTALMRAAARGHVEIMRLLIDRGADVNAQSDGNQTALLNAADMGQFDAVKLLLEKGADVKHVDFTGGTALYHAVEFGGNRGNKKGGGSVPIAKLLIEKGVDINATLGATKVLPEKSAAPLHCAILKGNKEMVQLLIAKGADVNVDGGKYETPLWLAKREFGSTHDAVFNEIARILVEHGAKE